MPNARRKMFAEFVQIGKLTDEEQRLLLNILKLRYELMQGHYDENNVTFEGEFEPEVKAMVIEALKRYDIPFKVNVHRSPKNIASASLDVIGSTWVKDKEDIQFKYHLKSSTAGISSKKNVEVEVYLSPLLLSKFFSDDNDRKVVIAHEFTHVAQLHSLCYHFVKVYMRQVRKKTISAEQWEKCAKIMNTVSEFQADILSLMYKDYAEAQREYGKDLADRPDIYVKSKDLYKLASRACALHEAEQRLQSLKSK